jgi:hypothetical protein
MPYLERKFEHPMEKAYCDASPNLDLDEDVANEQRMLDWRSTEWLSVQDAVMKFRAYCPEYNEFTAERLKALNTLGKDVQVQPARENSVCVYLKGNDVSYASVDGIAQLLFCDEVGEEPDGTIRVWWD